MPFHDLKEELKKLTWKSHRSSILLSLPNRYLPLRFYLAFPTGIYLFKINNINRETLCEICPKLTRNAPDGMCETKFLQICLFSIILISRYYFNFLFSLLFYVICTAIPKFPHWFLALLHRLPTFSAFPSRFLVFPSFSSPIFHFGFYR